MSAAAQSASGSATLANWRTSPFNRWAFHNVRAIVPPAPIENAPDDVWRLPEARKSLDAFRLRGRDERSLSLQDVLQATASDGLVVLLDGAIVFEDYRNGTTEHSPHITMSATKSITGLIAGILSSRGELDCAAPVSRYVPEIAETPYAGATVRELLDMRGGVRLDAGQLQAYAAATGWEPTLSDHPADLHAFFATMAGPPAAHGGPFAYISANTDLLGWAIERSTGKSFASLVSALLWKPMGAQVDAYITTDAKGAARATGGLCATVRDFARIGQLLVQDGARDGQAIIPPALLTDIVEGGDHEAWRTGEFAGGFAGMTMRYRSGWYVVDSGTKHIFAMGIHGQNLFVDRANRLVVAKVSSQATPLDYSAIGLTHAAYAEIRRCLLEAS